MTEGREGKEQAKGKGEIRRKGERNYIYAGFQSVAIISRAYNGVSRSKSSIARY